MLQSEEKPEQRDEQVSNPPSSESTGTSVLTTQQTTPNPQNESANDETQELQSFFNRVKREVRNQPEGYFDFFKMICVRRKRRKYELLQRVSNLIRGDSDIIVDFNRLFPQHRTDPDQREPVSISETQERKNICSFRKKVKRVFINQPEVMKEILSLLAKYRKERSDERTVMQQFSNKIHGCRRETIVEFNRLFPECRINPDQRRPVIISVSPIKSTGTSLSLSTQQTIANPPTASSLQTTHRTNPPTANPPTIEDAAKRYFDQLRYKLGNQPEVFNSLIDLTKQLCNIEKLPLILHQVRYHLRNHPELIVGYNELLPPEYKMYTNFV